MFSKLFLVFTFFLISVSFLLEHCDKDSKNDSLVASSELGFNILIVEETEANRGSPLWETKILISIKDYSPENLYKLVRWYSKKIPADKGDIILKIFTNKLDAEKPDEFDGIGDPNINDRRTIAPHNAIYFRNKKNGGDFYVYDLNPSNKDKKGLVKFLVKK